MAKVTAEKIKQAKEVLSKNSKYSELRTQFGEIKKTEALMLQTLNELEKDIKTIKAEKLTVLKSKAQLEKKALEEGDTVTMKVEDIDKSGSEGNDGDMDNSFDDTFGDGQDEGADQVVKPEGGGEVDQMKKEFMKAKATMENIERKMKLAEKK
jgi:hypothetical protein